MLNEILEQARKLPLVSASASAEHAEKRTLLVDYVDSAIESSAVRDSLLGGNPVQVARDNHAGHALFMSNVLQLGLYEMLVRVVMWAYRSYHARGFSYDYFPLQLKSWIRALQDNLQEEHAREIVVVYDWLLQRHEQFIGLVAENGAPEEAKAPHLEKTKTLFLQSLIRGDSRACLQLAHDFVKNREDVKDFYLGVIQPAMYEIGVGWEMGNLTVAQEHLASAIIARIMSSLYQNHVLSNEQPQRKAVVTAAPNEFHETGAHIIADFLEMHGWDVYYLGANIPVQDLRKLLLEKRPFLLAVSVTMPYNLAGVSEIVKAAREKPMNNIKIMVGGISFNLEPRLFEKVGADGWAANARDAVQLAQKWYEEAEQESVE